MMFNAALFFSAAALLFNPVVGWPTVFPRQGNGTTGGNETDPSEIGTPSPPPSQGNVTVGGVLLCEAIHWQSCNYTVLPVKECLDMKQIWNRSISSIGPDNGTVLLTFKQENCTGNGTGWIYPGSDDLMSSGWNDEIVSVQAVSDVESQS